MKPRSSLSAPPLFAPFRGLLYSPEKIRDLASVLAPPYDVISPDLQGRLYARDPYNVVRLILGRTEPDDTEENNRYTRAAADLKKWREAGILVRDARSAIYLYEQEFALEGIRRRRRGFLALCRLEDFGKRIYRHERTLEGPKKDRLRLIQQCAAQLSPVFGVYEDPEGKIRDLLAGEFEKNPDRVAREEEGNSHRLWRVVDPETIRSLAGGMDSRQILIADGHHRYETGLAYRDRVLKKDPHIGDRSLVHYCMMFCAEIGDPGLVILPTHRIVPLGKASPEAILASLRKQFSVESFSEENRFLKGLEPADASLPGFGLVMGAGSGAGSPYHWVTPPQASARLDVQWVHDVLIREILKISEVEEQRSEAIRYVKEKEEVFQTVRKDPRFLGVILRGIRPDRLLKAVRQGKTLPPKSTFFYPKLSSGLVLHPLPPDEKVTI